MNLKDFLANREKPPELFWSLVLEPGWVQAGLWFIKEDSAEVVSVGPASPWETDEDLIGASDAALSSAIQKLEEGSDEPSKTVFGVPSSWVTGGEIKAEYLEKIKKVCTELSLEPVGFVVLPEAIANLYKSEEGAPVSAIIVGLGKEFLEVAVFKLGNLVGTTSVSRSVSVVEDVTEGLSRFEGASPLPSRFIVYDGREGEIDDAKDALLSASWSSSEKIKFLHTPKVEGLNSDRKVFATSLAGASEIGHASRVVSNQEEKSENLPVEEEVANVAAPESTPAASDLGFAIGEDVSEEIRKPEIPPAPTPVRMPTAPLRRAFKPQASLDKIKTLFYSLAGRISFRPKIRGGFSGNRLYATLAVFVFGFIALFAFWWFYPKATVLVYVTPKSYNNESTISVSTDNSYDVANGIIPGRVLDAKVSGTKTSSATGSKLVGDKAKGTVKIGNSTSDSIDLPAGTTIASSGNLNFILDNEASISAGLDSFTPGTATVSVTAADIGAQYNLASGETFTVGNFAKSSVSAQSTSDFSGGTSQQILAVSEEDQTKLETDLTNELTRQAADRLSSQAGSNEIIAPDLVSIDKVDQTFSNKVGDEASNLKLDLQLDTNGIAVDKSKLIDYAKVNLKDKIPQGFVLRDDQVTFKFTFLKLNKGKYNFKLGVSANFLPIISTDEIINQISGKSPAASETYLSKIPGFNHAELQIRSPFPGFLKVLPEVTKNIDFEIVGEK